MHQPFTRIILIIVVATLPVIVAAVAPPPALAQHDPAHHSPYVNHETREIKSLSKEEVQQLVNGDGMGLALAAELNGYPGPKHVLELANELELSAEQLRATRGIFDRMRSSATALGKRIVHLEKELDEAFAGRSISDESLESLTTEIGALRGRLRATHLRAHLAQADILNTAQRDRYVKLRGYSGS